MACSDLDCSVPQIEAIYQKRWKVEVFHKTLKSNTALAKPPTKSIRTQTNHIFMSIYAAFQNEKYKEYQSLGFDIFLIIIPLGVQIRD